MYKNICLIIFILIISKIEAQNHRIFYELVFKKDSTSSVYERDHYILDINENTQKFYNYEFYQNDSIQKAKNKEYILSYPKLDIRLIHRKGGTFENYFLETPHYYLQKTKDTQDWKVVDEKKKIGKYTTQKAITKFGGRNWIAWFTSEIPFHFGPYKFHGLPGLILELYDSHENFKFSFKGNKNLNKAINTSSFLETFNHQKAIEVSEEQRQKLKIDYYLNPLKDFKDGMVIENEKGEFIEIDEKELTKKQQLYIKQYNNHIELDKAIKYPK